jgi:hypothetical protein
MKIALSPREKEVYDWIKKESKSGYSFASVSRKFGFGYTRAILICEQISDKGWFTVGEPVSLRKIAF